LPEHTHGTYPSTNEPVEAVINVKPAEGTVLTFDTYEGD
jgi:GntR family transcriptional regulator